MRAIRFIAASAILYEMLHFALNESNHLDFMLFSAISVLLLYLSIYISQKVYDKNVIVDGVLSVAIFYLAFSIVIFAIAARYPTIYAGGGVGNTCENADVLCNFYFLISLDSYFIVMGTFVAYVLSALIVGAIEDMLAKRSSKKPSKRRR